MQSIFLAVAFSVSQLISVFGKTNPIVVRGNAFFDSVTKERFYIRGVDYQPGGSSSLRDPLADRNCENDIPLFKSLGINSIRVYQVDTAQDHHFCMKALEDAGIYVILDATSSDHSINRLNAEASYNAIFLQHIFAKMDVFGKYDNLLAFFGGNEVVNDVATGAVSPWIKATIRDMKAYSKAQLKREIPIGYSAADVNENRVPLAEYLNCGDDPASRTDFYAFNIYSWCGSSSFEKSSYSQRVEDFKNYSVPLFFSEYGCNVFNDSPNGARPFTEVEAIYSEKMTPVFSGGLVYEWSQEINKYGLVDWSESNITPRLNFKNLQEEFRKTKNPSGDGKYKPNGKPSDCPENTDNFKVFAQLPPMPKAAEVYLKKGAGTPLGIKGPSNIDRGKDATLSGTEVPESSSKDSNKKDDDKTKTTKPSSGKVKISAAWEYSFSKATALYVALGVFFLF